MNANEKVVKVEIEFVYHSGNDVEWDYICAHIASLDEFHNRALALGLVEYSSNNSIIDCDVIRAKVTAFTREVEE